MRSPALLLAAHLLLVSLPAQEPGAAPRIPLPPMILPLDYTTPQPIKDPSGSLPNTPPMALSAPSALPAAPSARPMQPLAGMPRGDTSRFPVPSQAFWHQPQEDGPLWAGGSNWKASFDEAGFVVHPFLGSEARTTPVRWQLSRATVAGQDLEVAAVRPTYNGQRVTWQRGALAEYVDIAAGSLEQSFRFDRLPARGELVLDIGIETELAALVVDGGISFRNELGGLDYLHAVAIDAKGEHLPLVIELRGKQLSLRVPAAFVERAALPLIVDPVISATTITLGSPWEGQSDLAFDETSQEWLVVWNRQFSATDMDVWAQRLDASMAPVGAPFTIDYTGHYWFAPRVANLNATNTFLVVAEVSVDGLSTEDWWIAGCTVGAGPLGSVGNQFDIEHSGVVGLPGRNFWPDVGGDPNPYVLAGSYFTVVWTHETSASNHDIHLKQVDATGALRSTMPTVVDGSPSHERFPGISKSNGNTATAQTWVVAYQRTFSPADEDIRGAFVSWDGQLQLVAGQYNFPIESSTFSEASPHPSSPTDHDAASARRYSLVGYSRSNCTGCDGTWGVVSLIDNLGTRHAVDNLYSLGGAPLNVPSSIGGIDCDGRRFAVAGAVTDVFFGNADNFISTISFSLFPVVLSAHELVFVANSTINDEWAPSIAAIYSGGAVPSPRYGATYSFRATTGGNHFVVVALYRSPLPDECAIAQPLVNGVNGPFTTVGATTSAPSWCGLNTGLDLWFSYTATATMPVTFWTCTPTRDFDTVLQVFGGGCGALVSLGCVDDFCGLGSRVSINATFGTTYYVRVGGYNGAFGNFDVEVQPGTGLGAIVRNVHGCGSTTIATTGQPRIGGTVSTDIGNVTNIPMIGIGLALTGVPFCGCTIGHDWLVAYVSYSYVLNIPLNASLIGAVVAVQGADFLGAGGCPSPLLTLTDTMVITIG